MNGYFRLVSIGEDYGLKIYPPTDGGTPVGTEEIAAFLTAKEIPYMAEAIKKCAAYPDGDPEVLGSGECPQISESYQLTVSPDGMEASVRFYPPSETGSRMTQGEFLKDLQFKKIIAGLDMDLIIRHFEEGIYCTDFVIARGKQVRQGRDARIEYLFNTDNHAAPKVNEDGSVDYFNLQNINVCKKGDVLARIIKEDPGTMGVTVMGSFVKPKEVKRVSFRVNRNTELSEDKMSLIATVDGHVRLVDDSVFVSDVFEVDNVDVSTGNIEFEGSIQIKGNVCSGFRVKSGGNVVINGMVEGAYVEAGGDIVISRGINGMERGFLQAGGNIISKFIENATVSAQGYINTESIVNGTVNAGTEIIVDGKRGLITGSHVTAANYIKVKNLGSQMGVTTVVEAGINPVVKQQFLQIQKEMLDAQNLLKTSQPVLAGFKEKMAKGVHFSADQTERIRQMTADCENAKQVLIEKKELYLSLQEKLKEQGRASVEVYGEVYPGTTVVIKDLSMTVKSSYKFCRFAIEGGEVKMTGL